MDIHTMIANASADIRAMESRIQSLIDQLKSSNNECERLRTLNATITAEALHAKADLIHYQNVFVASACVEAMNMCKEFFATTHENMKARAEDAVKRMVSEKQEIEREEEITKVETVIEIDREERALGERSFEPEDGSVIQAPKGISFKETKTFYRKHINFVPDNPLSCPAFTYRDGKWVELIRKPSTEEVPHSLSTYLSKPREDFKGGVSKLVLGLF